MVHKQQPYGFRYGERGGENLLLVIRSPRTLSNQYTGLWAAAMSY